MINWLINNDIILLLRATAITLLLALGSLALGLILAFVFASMESFRVKWIAKLGTVIVIILRGLPEILVVIALYNALPMLLIAISDGFTVNLWITHFTVQYDVENFDVNPVICGILALSLLYAAYASQTLRGAFKAISPGQKQAAQLLGLSQSRTFFRIVLPQMWRHALPGLGNQWLVLLKDTALVSLITIDDLMKQTHDLIAYTHKPFTGYLIAGAIYLLISLISQSILNTLTQKSSRFESGISHG